MNWNVFLRKMQKNKGNEMVDVCYRNILQGEEIRKSLIELRSLIRDDAQKRALAYLLGGDFGVLTALLKHEDPKVRKNAALLLGEMETEDVLPFLFDAYQNEKTLYVRSDYLKAMEDLDCSIYLPALKERREFLESHRENEQTRKHTLEELSALDKILRSNERAVKHSLRKDWEPEEIILVTNRCQREAAASEIRTGTTTFFASGVRVRGGDLQEILRIRTWSEILFPIPKAGVLPGTAGEAAAALVKAGLPGFLTGIHTVNVPGDASSFRYRMDLRGIEDPGQRSSLIREISEELDRLSGHILCNDPSDYEAEIRLIVRKGGGFVPLLKLMTLKDGRFNYRKNSISASISPVNAALTVKLASPWLKEGADVLDPFCGVGTMLIERAAFLPCGYLYGVDLFGEAVRGARENALRAGKKINYITRDFFDFTHEYLFDEVITDLPPLGEDPEKFIRRFAQALAGHLKDGAVTVLYLPGAERLIRILSDDGRYSLLDHFMINEKNGTQVCVFRFGR